MDYVIIVHPALSVPCLKTKVINTHMEEEDNIHLAHLRGNVEKRYVGFVRPKQVKHFHPNRMRLQARRTS
jgi:hypothetical protein